MRGLRNAAGRIARYSKRTRRDMRNSTMEEGATT